MLPSSAAQVSPSPAVLRAIAMEGDIGTPFGFRIERDYSKGNPGVPKRIKVYGTDGVITLELPTQQPVAVSAMYALPDGWEVV